MDEEARAQLRAQHVGFVFQSLCLFLRLTRAGKRVELPAPSAAVKTAVRGKAGRKRCSKQLDWERLDHLPAQLSGGEQQRELARAFNGRVLMCCVCR